eukprot:5559002-Alexandrium_andersonii.AAC.1
MDTSTFDLGIAHVGHRGLSLVGGAFQGLAKAIRSIAVDAIMRDVAADRASYAGAAPVQQSAFRALATSLSGRDLTLWRTLVGGGVWTGEHAFHAGSQPTPSCAHC